MKARGLVVDDDVMLASVADPKNAQPNYRVRARVASEKSSRSSVRWTL